MLHDELLIWLRGHPGYVFVVNPTLTFLHPCEVSAKVSTASTNSVKSKIHINNFTKTFIESNGKHVKLNGSE